MMAQGFRRLTVSILTAIVLSSGIALGGDEVDTSTGSLNKFQQVRLATADVRCIDRFAGGGIGVIVTPKGHVVIQQAHSPGNHDIHTGDRLLFHLQDGRKVHGTALGWSDEWGIALAQISGKGPWPHVELCPSDDVRVGIPCVSMGPFQVVGPLEQDEHFLSSFGKVRRIAQGRWLTSTCAMSGHNGVFDQQGRLLGLTTVIPLGDDERVQTHAAMIRELWDDLVDGKNVDKLRALSLTRKCGSVPAIESEASKEDGDKNIGAIELVKRTTVRIRPAHSRGGWGDRGWSGVVVTAEGHIVTCGHHDRIPGDYVMVHFSDGSKARGRVVGTNLVTDIGVVKIVDDGQWTFSKLGLSQHVSPGDPCIFAGYPATHEGVEPIVRKGSIVEPDGYEWCSKILASGFEFQGGDSGGGLFDENGVLVATLIGGTEPLKFTRHARSEFFHLQWNDLTSGQPVDVAPR